MLDLILYHDQITSLVQAQLEIVRKSSHHCGDLILLMNNGHTVKGIQGIIKKMRVDLLLEKMQLLLSLPDLGIKQILL